MTQTKSLIVLEYVGGESGVIMIAGLAVFSYFVIRHINSGKLDVIEPLYSPKDL